MERKGQAAWVRHCDAGVTLIELLIALSLLALLVMVGLPAMGSMLERSRVATAATSMAVSLANVRSRAVQTGRPHTLCPSTRGLDCDPGADWSTGWIVFADRNHSGQREDPEVVADRVEGGTAPHVRIRTTQGRARLVFQPDGSAGGSNVTIEFCARGSAVDSARQLVVSNVGRARLVERPAVTQCNR
ncbi:MAG: GspH/FimT family pseudopilin [Burkholderiaceae bacterium]|nr:GspH/FimT family pseudopilin [Burkholderiaceae bacterium]